MAAAELLLTASTGRPTGSRPANRLRAEGKVPAVVYGAGTEATAVSVEWRELRAVLTTDAGLNALITLDVDGDKKLTLVKDMQRHPVRRDVTHVDFIVIDRNKPVEVEVPIVLVNTEGDNLNGLVLDQQLYVLPISAKPDSIPNEIEVDCGELTLDTPITVGSLTLPAGVEATVDADDAIATASVPQAAPVEGDEAEGEGDEAAEGDAEASAEGEGEGDGGDAEGGDEG